ncbi:MAG: acetate--CoA ligase family protein [Anaerolineae bacterium]|nr:acetate--CoA ligase family protein [Anaerolineae bacterium]
MVKLHEYQGKQILAKYGISLPQSILATSPNEARQFAEKIGAVVVKAQVWTTSRAAQNLIHFAATSDEAAQAANTLIGQRVGNFIVEHVLVEEQVAIEQEWYLGLIIDDQARVPVLLFSAVGGSGIEEILTANPNQVIRHQINIREGLQDFEAREICRRAGIGGRTMLKLSQVIRRFYDATRYYEARSAEINPLVLTKDGQIMALDARFTIDDYALFRHPDLDIEVARELDRPPTKLEKIAWQVEKDDYRGTFYFIQMMSDFEKGQNVVGFHGAGGGGSMMNMDALLARGFQIANFVDTSGNPPASKVYRAARIILSQANIDGYYAGGSGVASQEQFHSARGLVKAFMDTQLNIPAVIRIGGNAEEEAIDILQRAKGTFPAPLEAYGRDDSPDMCAERLQALIETYEPLQDPPVRENPQAQDPYQFETVTGGTVTFDHALCRNCESKICIETCVPQILSLDEGVPVLNIGHDEAKRGACTECLACEVECYFLGNRGGIIHLPIQGLSSEKNHADID